MTYDISYAMAGDMSREKRKEKGEGRSEKGGRREKREGGRRRGPLLLSPFSFLLSPVRPPPLLSRGAPPPPRAVRHRRAAAALPLGYALDSHTHLRHGMGPRREVR